MSMNLAEKAGNILLIVVAMSMAGCGGGESGDSSSDTPLTAAVATADSRGKHVKVTALFATNGAKWNDYVAGNVSTATDTACNAATDTACLHGGERRVVVVTGKNTCNGLTATDELGAFNWVCDGSIKPVRLVSTGLASSKNLSDLIDFTTKTFKPNRVTVKANNVAWIVTPSTVWWTNPIVENNRGGHLNAASTLYLVTSNPNPAAQYDLDADKAALVIQPGLILQGPGANAVVIYSNHHNLWIEGAMNASGYAGVFLDSVRFSVLRNVAAANGKVGVQLNLASNNTLSGVTASNNTPNNGVTLANASNNNTLSGVTANNNAANGVLLVGASNNNTLSGVTASNNNAGVTLANASNNNTLSDVTAGNNGTGIVIVDGAANNTLSGVTASNNAFGVFLGAASNNMLSGVTASNNSDFGVLVANASNNNTLSAVTAGNNTSGVALSNFSGNNTLSGVTASNNNTGVILSETSNNRFTGLLEVGNNFGDCSVNGGTLPGLDFACTNNGSSDATLTLGINLASSFAGKVTSGDSQNANDTNGTAAFPLDPAVFDWTHFDNAYRGWGLDGSAFPDQFQRGRWTAGTGRIWDWSVSSGDSGNSGSPALRGVLVLPTGNDTLTHIWSGIPGTSDNAGCDAMVPGSVWNGSACATTFLRNALEILADGIGNDNNLCENGETCLHTPNIGSYQGHGNLVSAGTFTNGTLSGITLMKFATNGR